MKKVYSEPEAKFIWLNNADVIATSGEGDPIDPTGTMPGSGEGDE